MKRGKQKLAEIMGKRKNFSQEVKSLMESKKERKYPFIGPVTGSNNS